MQSSATIPSAAAVLVDKTRASRNGFFRISPSEKAFSSSIYVTRIPRSNGTSSRSPLIMSKTAAPRIGGRVFSRSICRFGCGTPSFSSSSSIMRNVSSIELPLRSVTGNAGKKTICEGFCCSIFRFMKSGCPSSCSFALRIRADTVFVSRDSSTVFSAPEVWRPCCDARIFTVKIAIISPVSIL